MSFNGFEGIDLTGVEATDMRVLGTGRHVVKITEAKIKSDKNKGMHQLELKYSNDHGSIRHWIIVYHKSSAEATRIGLEQLKSLLLILGHEGDKTPDVNWFVGKTVGINVKEETYQGQTKLRVNYNFDPDSSGAEEETKRGEHGEIEDTIPW